MMKKAVYLLIAIILLNTSVSARGDKNTALTINGRVISKKELQKDFLAGQGTLVDKNKTSIDEFLKGYIFHALVLEEARHLQLDTTKHYKEELEIYKKQLVNSFLKDTISDKTLANELLMNFREEIKVNQVFIPFDSTLVLPKDTIAPYNRALMARKTAIEEGFDKVISEKKMFTYGVIMDIERETGELGWLKAFMFSYKLNKTLYSLKLNEVTMPIRSDKGYHVLQVIDRRPIHGTPVVEQVMFNFPVIPATKNLEDSIYHVAMKTYEEIELKDNFQEICDEFATAYDRGENGCLLGGINMGDAIPASLIKASYDLKAKGEVSKPILSAYGWHILRLKDIVPVAPDSILKASLKEFIASDKIYPELLARQRMKMLKESNAKIFEKPYAILYSLTDKYSPNTDEFLEHVSNKSDILININNKITYTVGDFLEYTKTSRWLFEQPANPEPLMQSAFAPMVILTLSTDILETQFNGFVYTVLSNYERDFIAEREPKYTPIFNKLSEDLLFTKLMESEVWNKSINDAEGLQNVYSKNKDKYSLNGNPFKGLIIYSKDENIVSAIEKKYVEDKPVASELRRKYNQDELQIQVEEGLWNEGENKLIDNRLNSKKLQSPYRNFPYYTIIGKTISKPEDLSDVRHQVQKDYQEELESALSELLSQKYDVIINRAVIKTIK